MIDNRLSIAKKAIDNQEFTVPSKLMQERLYNPFIRCAREPYFK